MGWFSIYLVSEGAVRLPVYVNIQKWEVSFIFYFHSELYVRRNPAVENQELGHVIPFMWVGRGVGDKIFNLPCSEVKSNLLILLHLNNSDNMRWKNRKRSRRKGEYYSNSDTHLTY